jgi:hypothetical protein
MKMTMVMIVKMMMIVKLLIKMKFTGGRYGATASLSLCTNSSDKPLRLYRSSGGSGEGYNRREDGDRDGS